MANLFPPKNFLSLWEKNGFNKPTTIQEQSLTPILNGENLLGISPTGTGKTLAYLLPALERLSTLPAKSQLLIIAPSQELAAQIQEVARIYGSILNFKVAGLIGGGNVKRQQEKLKKKPEILVGTPGRVLELLQSKKIKWPDLKIIILDEVDLLLKEPGNLTEKILNHGIKDYQLLGFSATELGEELREKYFTNQLQLAPEEMTIEQSYIMVEKRKKVQLLKRLAQIPNLSALVFFNQLQDLGVAYEKLKFEGVKVENLASDENKFQRKEALNNFKEGKATFLLTTDVASRGIDLEKLPYVISFDLPQNTEQFIHRKGRTGRMGEKGEVLVFSLPQEVSFLKKLPGNFTEKTVSHAQLIPVTSETKKK